MVMAIHAYNPCRIFHVESYSYNLEYERQRTDFSQVNDQPVNDVWRNYGPLLRELIETYMYIVRVT
jgi:hypothetical protein